jgi:cytochrome c-type biogenesis protein CcmF
MENIGALAILLAFCISFYAIVASVVGKIKNRPFLIVSGERAVYAVWVLITTASGILVYSLLTSDFRFAYVAGHSNRDMDTIYKITAWWGGQEGSLLFWSWILSTYSAVAIFTNRHKLREIMPWVAGILSFVQLFFLLINNFVANPFQMLAVDKVVTSVADGLGLNPQLQYYAMAIHPPMLYLGYVGFAVPFAFAMGSLISRQPGDNWIHTTRRWSIVAWLFQSCGIMLGSAWAFDALGWGGYWMWDPVENASLLPWLAGTAFLHSVMMQEKKGMMKVWNMVLIATTFFLCIFGTFLTRSGIVSSVHAFAESSIGRYFVGFLAIGISATVYLILDRLQYLKSEAPLESVVSRESSFLFNNLLLLASCFAVLWGTLFPVISEAVSNEKIALDAPWFNRLMIPIGLGLLFLTGVGPLFAWRRTSIESLRRNFMIPGLLGCVLAAGLFFAGIHNFWALISLGLCMFVTATIVSEFFRGSIAIAQKQQMNFFRATIELTHRNTRRYGGYLVHMGIVLMFVGWTGQAFNKNVTAEVAMGKTFSIGAYDLKVADVNNGDNANYRWDSAVLEVTKHGKPFTTLEPERRYYKAAQQGLGHVALYNGLDEDLYVNFASSDGQGKVTLQGYVFPLVSWIWIGTMVLILGTLIALVPSKVQRQYARTQIVGVASTEKPLAVEN